MNILGLFVLLALTLLSNCELYQHSATGHLHENEDEVHTEAKSLHYFEIVNSRKQVRSYELTQKRSFGKRDGTGQPFPDELQVYLDSFNTTFFFNLEVNGDLIHRKFQTTVYGNKAGDIKPLLPTHRFYKGTVTSSKYGEGWARLTLFSVSDDALIFRGIFIQGEEIFEVKTTDHFRKLTARVSERGLYSRKRVDQGDVDMVVFKYSDFEIHDPEAEKCGVDDSHFHLLDDHLDSPGLLGFDLNKRVDTGCPTSQKALYVGVAAESTYTTKFGGAESTQDQILSDFNSVSALYESTYNVMIGVVNIKIRTATGADPADENGGSLAWNVGCSSGYTISQRLSDFSNWRGKQPADAGLWHLMSTCPTGSTIGIAWLNQLCNTNAFSQDNGGSTEYVSGCGVSTSADTEWLVVAHEMGHNFGAKHDCTSTCSGASDTSCCTCPPGCDCKATYIMHPSNSISTHTFSPCSQTTMCSRSAITGVCFEEPGTRAIMNQNVCGNGIWEVGEECDCGGTLSCANDTCCFENCTLTAGSECSDFNSKCCQNCTILHSTNEVCRDKKDDCDVAEYCDGTTAVCPKNVYQEDGTVCSEISDGYCASGVCTNRVQQCINVGMLYEKPQYNKDCLGSCRLFCESPLEGCRYFPGNFLNGTKCDNGGVCYGGICSSGDVVGDILDFIEKNKILVIVGASILGLLIVGFLLWGCRRANRKAIPGGQSQAQLKKGGQKGKPGQRPPQKSAQGNQRPPSQGHPGNQRPPSQHGPPPPQVQLQVRCPICQQYFPSEANLDRHLDVDHA